MIKLVFTFSYTSSTPFNRLIKTNQKLKLNSLNNFFNFLPDVKVELVLTGAFDL